MPRALPPSTLITVADRVARSVEADQPHAVAYLHRALHPWHTLHDAAASDGARCRNSTHFPQNV